MTTAAAVALCLVLAAAAAPLGIHGSLLPFFNRQSSSSSSSNNNNLVVAERFPDPFRILEHVPFALERDELLLSPARVDWKETPDSHVISIDVPGLKREELKIEVDENRVLRVSGERRREEERKDEHWHYSERAYGKFWRQLRLAENADLDSVAAKLEDGVLTVCMKKLSPDKIKKPRLVSIAAAEGAGGTKPKLTAAAGAKEDL